MPSLRSIKQYIGLPVSPSPERNPVTGKRRRAESPSPLTSDQLEALRQQYLARQQEELAIQQEELARQQEEFARKEQADILRKQSDEEVNAIIDSINSYIDVDVDNEDPIIRYIVIMIVKSNKARPSAQTIYQKLARSKLLLTAIANVIIKVARKSGTGILNIVKILLPIITQGAKQSGTLVAETGIAAYDFASTAASTTASTFRGYLTSPQREGRLAASPPRETSYHDMASTGYNLVATGLSEFYRVLTRVLGRVYELLEPCVSEGASIVASVVSKGFEKLRAMCSTPEQAVAQAVKQVVPDEEEFICAICMEGEENDLLGYVAVHNPPLDNHATGYIDTGHPNRFHMSCLQGCRNKCPICRAPGPVWGMQRRQRQGGGGLKKYRSKSRSKSKSKSKSKSRRYVSKPQKSRKARKRVRHASSRRR